MMHVMRVLDEERKGLPLHGAKSRSADVAASSRQGAGAETLLKGALTREVESKRGKARGRGRTATTKSRAASIIQVAAGGETTPAGFASPLFGSFMSQQQSKPCERAAVLGSGVEGSKATVGLRTNTQREDYVPCYSSHFQPQFECGVYGYSQSARKQAFVGPFGAHNSGHGRTAYAVPIEDVHPTRCEGISVLHTSAASFCETQPERSE